MVYFIAEISSNHSQDLSRCYDFIDKSAEIGCDAVKFQLFLIDKLFTKTAIHYKPFIEERRKWELPVGFLPLLAERCHEKKIQFTCSPFYIDAVEELKPFVSFYKIASYALLWDDLLAACAHTGKPVILSTGMATMYEIHHALSVLREAGCNDIALLHCISAYPTPAEEANLAAIETLRKNTGCRIGWSDHSVQPGIIYRAIHHWGAEVIEFHFDLDKKGAEFQVGHCWLPSDIAPLIQQVRLGLNADGSGTKEPSKSELIEREWRTDPADGLRPLKKIRESLIS